MSSDFDTEIILGFSSGPTVFKNMCKDLNNVTFKEKTIPEWLCSVDALPYVVKLFLKSGLSPNSYVRRICKHITWLQYAIEINNRRLVLELLLAGADVEKLPENFAIQCPMISLYVTCFTRCNLYISCIISSCSWVKGYDSTISTKVMILESIRLRPAYSSEKDIENVILSPIVSDEIKKHVIKAMCFTFRYEYLFPQKVRDVVHQLTLVFNRFNLPTEMLECCLQFIGRDFCKHTIAP